MKKATEFLKGEGKEKNKLIKVLQDCLGRPFEPATLEDEEFFKFAVGRKPSAVFAVLKRCRFGHPVAFASLPLKGNEPFPTVFWLTCPYLMKICGKLEAALFHKNIESEIEKSEKLKHEFRDAHRKMKEIRQKLAEAASIEIPPSVMNTGIAGVRNTSSVKCLHAHLAAALAGIESPVSRALYEAITVFECYEDCLKKR